LVSVMVRGSLH